MAASLEEVSDTLGINTPLLVAVTSRMALAFGVGVPMPTWAWAFEKVSSTDKTAAMGKRLFFTKTFLNGDGIEIDNTNTGACVFIMEQGR